MTARLICFGQFLRAVDWRTQSDLGTWMVHTVFLGHHGWREVLYFPERSFQQTTWMNYFVRNLFAPLTHSECRWNKLFVISDSIKTMYSVCVYIHICLFILFVFVCIHSNTVSYHHQTKQLCTYYMNPLLCIYAYLNTYTVYVYICIIYGHIYIRLILDTLHKKCFAGGCIYNMSIS